MSNVAGLPPWIVLDPLIQSWLIEDIGRGDRTTQGLLAGKASSIKAVWVAKAPGVVAGLPLASRVFQLLDTKVSFVAIAREGQWCEVGEQIATIEGTLDSLLTGERLALNLAMRLSGITTLTREYARKIADLPARLVDTRKTTPGLRIMEKYASQLGGAVNHRMGLDDAVMIKDNHIVVAGGIGEAITLIRSNMPYPLTIEVETESLEQVEEALQHGADIIMLDNMPPELMILAVKEIRDRNSKIKIEASGNITLDNIRAVALTGVDYISTSALITQSKWLDLSMRILR
ncbi:carboxylating nicotinate-nucleotide diphosphorylase [Synechocystis sp. PCC 7509]|uniref:carboxylating nicotinate-nucleotide diphosphorylase n=1 Tax=Synechocystis sp. PCC 7509 TaxID=927677 RepID=UPI0002AC0170|nr:carboxylating nicotinate-nucleotide diphosphorylase [Synechocystis sp. PCC 7509]